MSTFSAGTISVGESAQKGTAIPVLTSRCTMFFPCKYEMAEAISMAIVSLLSQSGECCRENGKGHISDAPTYI